MSRKAVLRDDAISAAEFAKSSPVLLTDAGNKKMIEVLTCAICREILYIPITLEPCGHTFCNPCFYKQKMQACDMSCPTCGNFWNHLSLNAVLERTIIALFPTEWSNRSKETWIDAELEQIKATLRQEIKKEVLEEMREVVIKKVDDTVQGYETNMRQPARFTSVPVATSPSRRVKMPARAVRRTPVTVSLNPTSANIDMDDEIIDSEERQAQIVGILQGRVATTTSANSSWQ